MAMAQEGGEQRHLCIHIEPLAVPALYGSYGEGMAQIVQSGAMMVIGCTQPYSLAEQNEGLAYRTIDQACAAFG
jgi:hypothetical protein